jgi:hypothetical protein
MFLARLVSAPLLTIGLVQAAKPLSYTVFLVWLTFSGFLLQNLIKFLRLEVLKHFILIISSVYLWGVWFLQRNILHFRALWNQDNITLIFRTFLSHLFGLHLFAVVFFSWKFFESYIAIFVGSIFLGVDMTVELTYHYLMPMRVLIFGLPLLSW